LPYCGISAELSPGTQAVVLQDPTDPQALAKALQSLVDQPERMLQLAAGGHAWAQQKTWAQCARAHEAVFAQVTSNRR
jgi:glycosyltransferase involved in cell wall biosynthesis